MASLFRLVHAAQARLDVPIRGFYSESSPLSASARVTLEDASLDAFDTLVEKTRDANADALMLIGNTLSAADRSLRARRRLEDGLRRLAEAGVPTVIVCGPLDSPAIYSDMLLPESTHVLSHHRPRVEIETLRGLIGFQIDPASSSVSPAVGRRTDCEICIVPPGGESVEGTAVADQHSRRFDPPHGIGRGSSACYVALGQGLPTSTQVQSAFVHDPGPLAPLAASYSGRCGASLVEIDSAGGVRTSAMHCSPVKCETVPVPLAGIRSLESLAESMLSRFPRLDDAAELNVIRWVLAGRGPVTDQLKTSGAWDDVVSLVADGSHQSVLHLHCTEPAADDLDEVASMLADEYHDFVRQQDPDPRDLVDTSSPQLERVLQRAAESPKTAARIRELGTAVFAADCDELWGAA